MSLRIPLTVPGSPPEEQEPLIVPVALADHPYQIVVGEGLWPRLGEYCPGQSGARGLIVTDENVAGLYAERCQAGLRAAGWEISLAVVPPGEGSKTLAMAERLYEACLEAELDRGSTIFALGGGVIGDLAGFVAGTFMRGIRFIPLPTTLLAQVDASVGGKTAVDLPRAKNVVGVFHQPAVVIIDLETVQSLPEREFLCGLAEIVKHAAIADAEMFVFLQEQREQILARAPRVLRPLVARNCQIKAEVVQADPQESGWRAVLNYGHTLGHALERAAPEWALRHGEAVAYGMIGEARMAERLGLAEPGLAAVLQGVLQGLGLARGRPPVDEERARQALRHDKKLRARRLKLPIVPRPGAVYITEDINLSTLEAALQELLASL